MHFQYDTVAVAVGFYIYSAITQALPEPLPMERWYGFLYRLMHLLAANFRQLHKVNGNGLTTGQFRAILQDEAKRDKAGKS